MAKLKSAIPILAWVVTTALRLPVFYIFEKIYIVFNNVFFNNTFFNNIFFIDGKIWCLYGLFLATLMLILRQDQLFKLYGNLTTGILLLYLPLKYGMKVSEPTLNDSAIILCSANGILALYLSEETWKAAVLMVNSLPVAAVYIGLSPYITNCIYSFTTTVIICYLSCRIPLSLGNLLVNIRQWIDYNVAKPVVDSIQQQLFVFWMATFAYRAAFPVKGTAYVDRTMSWSDWITFLSTCFEKCCRTPVGLLATSVAVSRATSYARLLLEKFLYGFRKIDRHVRYTEGLAEGSFFFLVSINFGVLKEHHIYTHLDVQRRLFLLHVTSFFVMAVFLETTYQMLDSKITSFSDSTEHFLNHIRALMTYILLLFSSCYVMYTVCKLVSTETAVTLVSLTGSTIIQIVGSLLVYTLNLIDVKYSIENLDDTIIYIRTSVCILGVVGSIIGAFSGLGMIIVKGLGWTPCLMIQSYYQVWNKFNNGYDAFISWSNSRKKINSFVWATNEELRNHDDVCPICYQHMSSARITPCGHFYHQRCLQEWIKDNSTCPLCSCRISV